MLYKIIGIILFLLVFSSKIFTQPQLTMDVNNSIQDIHFASCSELIPLGFRGFFNTTFDGNKTYIWTLYRDNTALTTFTQIIPCNTTCFPGTQCELPSSVFANQAPVSGTYQIKLEIKKAIFINVLCIGYFQTVGGVINTYYSNTINVTRFDDGFECKCEVPQNLTVSCSGINSNPPIPRTFRAVHNVDMSCAIHNDRNVTLIAGDKILLLPGFRSGTGGLTHFRAYLDPCNITIGEPSRNTTDSTLVSDTLIESPTTQTPINQNMELNREKQNQYMVIYPNPNDGNFDVFINDEGQENGRGVYIYNTIGEIMKQFFLTGTLLHIDLSALPKGMYFVKVISKENLFTQKIILQY